MNNNNYISNRIDGLGIGAIVMEDAPSDSEEDDEEEDEEEEEEEEEEAAVGELAQDPFFSQYPIVPPNEGLRGRLVGPNASLAIKSIIGMEVREEEQPPPGQGYMICPRNIMELMVYFFNRLPPDLQRQIKRRGKHPQPCIVWRMSDVLEYFTDVQIQTLTPVELLNNANIRPLLFRHTKQLGTRSLSKTLQVRGTSLTPLSDKALTVLNDTLVACTWSSFTMPPPHEIEIRSIEHNEGGDLAVRQALALRMRIAKGNYRFCVYRESDRTLLKICIGITSGSSTVEESIGMSHSDYVSNQAFLDAGENGLGQRSLATSSDAPAVYAFRVSIVQHETTEEELDERRLTIPNNAADEITRLRNEATAAGIARRGHQTNRYVLADQNEEDFARFSSLRKATIRKATRTVGIRQKYAKGYNGVGGTKKQYCVDDSHVLAAMQTDPRGWCDTKGKRDNSRNHVLYLRIVSLADYAGTYGLMRTQIRYQLGRSLQDTV